MVGGAGTFRPLQFGGNGTELLNRTRSERQALAVEVLDRKNSLARALVPQRISLEASTRVRQRQPPDSDAGWMDFFHGSGVGKGSFQHTHKECPVYQRMHSALGESASKKSAFEERHLGAEIMPPLCEETAVELMNYYYLVWLSKQNPGDQQLSMKVKSYGAVFADSLTFAGESAVGDTGRAQDFLSAVKKSAFRSSQDLQSQKIVTDVKIESLLRAKDEDVARFSQEQAEAIAAIQSFYAQKSQRLSDRIERQRQPSQFMEKAKKLAAKIGIGIGSVLTGLGTAFNQVKNIIREVTEHIPVLSNVPPELVGAWGIAALAGGWMLSKGFVKVLAWHFEIIKAHLPAREAKKKAAARDRFDSLRDSVVHDFEVAKRSLLEECASRHRRTEQAFREEYRHMLSMYGYLSPN